MCNLRANAAQQFISNLIVFIYFACSREKYAYKLQGLTNFNLDFKSPRSKQGIVNKISPVCHALRNKIIFKSIYLLSSVIT